jgi:hypothetical protein
MTRVRSDTRRLRALFDTSALRSTMLLRLPKKLTSEIPGQSCRALPAFQPSKRAKGLNRSRGRVVRFRLGRG